MSAVGAQCQAGQASVSQALPESPDSGIGVLIEVHLKRISHLNTLPDERLRVIAVASEGAPDHRSLLVYGSEAHRRRYGRLNGQPSNKQLQGVAGDGGARHVLDVPAAEDGADDLLVDVFSFAGCAHGRTEQQLAPGFSTRPTSAA